MMSVHFITLAAMCCVVVHSQHLVITTKSPDALVATRVDAGDSEGSKTPALNSRLDFEGDSKGNSPVKSEVDPQVNFKEDSVSDSEVDAQVQPKVEDGTNTEESRNANREKFFFGSSRVLTNTNVVFTTSTRPLLCVMAINTAATCLGRRKRSVYIKDLHRRGWAEDGRSTDSASLDSSQLEPLHDASMDSSGSPEGKFAFTVWSQVNSATTLTYFSTDSSTTLSLSYACSVGFLDVPPRACNVPGA